MCGMRIDISELVPTFPDFRVAVLVADGLAITPARPDALEAIIAARQAEALRVWGTSELGAIPGIQLSLLGRAAGEKRLRRPTTTCHQFLRRCL
jgi:hypothetical protein